MNAMKQKLRPMELIMNLLFFICGFIAIVFVLFISIYLIISGIPAIREIGLVDFLFGQEWASTAAEPKFGILPFILTSVYGTCGAIIIGVPVGFMTAVFLAKVASPRLAAVVRPAVDLLAGIPSVVYGLIGMMVLVPAVREAFDLPDGASLFCAIIVLAVMILPSIISVSETALKAVPPEYEEASLALGATHIETVFRVSVPAASSGIAAAVVLGIGRAIGEAMAIIMVAGNVANMPVPLLLRPVPDHRRGQRDGLRLRPPAPGPVLHRPGAVHLHHAHQRRAQHGSQAEEGGLTWTTSSR